MPTAGVGDVVRVRCAATSANLGPGFDAFGLALGLANDVEAEVTSGGVRVRVRGEGAQQLEVDGTNLVARAASSAFARLGWRPPGLRLACDNRVPTSRGLGSSAAAIVAGAALAHALARPDEPVDHAWLVRVAGEIEGHPDNVAACVLGGLTVAWRTADGEARAVRVEPHPDLRVLVLVPAGGASTAVARALLPSSVPHADAARNAGRAGLLVAAVTERPDLLLEATDDRLHQPYRASSMPATSALVTELRARGIAAVVSGAGPSVLVLGSAGDGLDDRLVPPDGWRVLDPGIERGGVRVDRVQAARE